MSEAVTEPVTRLGHEAAHRLRTPGPSGSAARPARIGVLASASARFAAATRRAVPVRHALRGPEPVAVRSVGESAEARPPRWWAPGLLRHDARRATPDLPGRGLPRAVRQVPNESTWTPGGVLAGLTTTTAPVRRLDEVTAAGPMLTSSDRRRRTVAGDSAAPARPVPLVPARATPGPGPGVPAAQRVDLPHDRAAHSPPPWQPARAARFGQARRAAAAAAAPATVGAVALAERPAEIAPHRAIASAMPDAHVLAADGEHGTTPPLDPAQHEPAGRHAVPDEAEAVDPTGAAPADHPRPGVVDAARIAPAHAWTPTLVLATIRPSRFSLTSLRRALGLGTDLRPGVRAADLHTRPTEAAAGAAAAAASRTPETGSTSRHLHSVPTGAAVAPAPATSVQSDTTPAPSGTAARTAGATALAAFGLSRLARSTSPGSAQSSVAGSRATGLGIGTRHSPKTFLSGVFDSAKRRVQGVRDDVVAGVRKIVPTAPVHAEPARSTAAIRRGTRPTDGPLTAAGLVSLTLDDVLTSVRGHGRSSAPGSAPEPLRTGFTPVEEIRPSSGGLGTGDTADTVDGARGSRHAVEARHRPAPPPVSMRPRSVSAPPPPVAARGSSESSSFVPSAEQLAAAPRATGSLVESSLALFQAAELSELALGMHRGTTTVTEHVPAHHRRSGPAVPATGGGPSGHDQTVDDPHRLNELVDRVVERIERRVVDELERRGRRHVTEGF